MIFDFQVLFPKPMGFLMKNNLIELIPKKSIDFVQDILNQIIEKRKNGTEVILI
jgi:hypothetical protein